jgi:hypothetical protein
MPRLSLETVVLRALNAAVQDRESLSNCYQKDDLEHDEFRAKAKAFQTLVGKLAKRGSTLSKLSLADQALAFEVLVCAEQHEDSLADAHHRRGQYAQESLVAAKLYRNYRLRHWGKTSMEAMVERSVVVSLHNLHRVGHPSASNEDKSPEA